MGIYTKVAGIYCIANIESNKKYIGYSKNIKKRWDNHKFMLRRNISNNTHLQSAWNLYGEKMFVFSILEVMPFNLTKREYEKIETKWVLHFSSHLSEFGYNGVLPGSIPLSRKEENTTGTTKQITEYVCINTSTKEVVKLVGVIAVSTLTGILSHSKITDLASYWDNKCRRKSLYGWIIVREGIYNPEFDYINFKKQRPSSPIKKTWRDYNYKSYIKKTPEEYIPREKRNLKRVPIIAVNIETGEEKFYPMLKSCYKEFDRTKVYKCINNPFGKYKHRGHYFKRAEMMGDIPEQGTSVLSSLDFDKNNQID